MRRRDVPDHTRMQGRESMTVMASGIIPAVAMLALGLLTPGSQEHAAAAIERVGGTFFRREGGVVEVTLNRADIPDGDPPLLPPSTAMTDLSLEETPVG